ncbi:hypothetical protein dsx2_3361 [Desulfovibrio sp. X2]|nr:hypothetical protein [Desulfovibrio sp. X2]EPR40234.1 hypothetical protein dsx2_3361 [Desulfovibrio sp. X2]
MNILNIPLRIACLALSVVNKMLGGALDPIFDTANDKSKDRLGSIRA